VLEVTINKDKFTKQFIKIPILKQLCLYKIKKINAF